MNLLCLVPSYHGAQLETVSTIRAIERECWARGHGFDMIGQPRMVIDMARAELMAKARATEADIILWLDDDCQLPATKLFDTMLPLLSDARPMVMAPYRLRCDEVAFCVEPAEPPVTEVSGIRTQKLKWGGLGIVLMQKRVLDVMHKNYPKLHYTNTQGKNGACGVFASAVVNGEYTLDDRVFFSRAARVGISLWAAVDVETIHDRRVGCYGHWLDYVATHSEKGAAE